MITAYIIISTLIFFLLFLVWARTIRADVIIKFGLFAMTMTGVFMSLVSYGVIAIV